MVIPITSARLKLDSASFNSFRNVHGLSPCLGYKTVITLYNVWNLISPELSLSLSMQKQSTELQTRAKCYKKNFRP